MNKIQPCLWFDHQAEEAAKFYTSAFRRSKLGSVVRYGKAGAAASGQPEGSVMTVEFELEGLRFLGLNGGPHFQLNPSISLFVGCESEQEIDELWGKLVHQVRMELQPYPFAEKFGWCADRFGVDWQLILGRRRQKIAPALLFANERYGKADEAIRFYVSQFPDSRVETITRDEKTNAVLHATFTLMGQEFLIMESALKHEFDFSPAFSFIINAASQAELDELWSKLSAVPEAEQCGWLEDRFGVSWQLVHENWRHMITDADPARRDRLMNAVLKMKKLDVAELQRVFEQGT